MKFGPIPIAAADGALLAHAVRAGDILLRKGQRLGPAECAALAAAGIAEVIAARLDPDRDRHEDEAARRLAGALTGDGLAADEAAAGRVNLRATVPGLLVVDAAGVHAFNRIDDGITLATLPPFAPLEAGTMAATVKIIPFAVGLDAVTAALESTTQRPPIRLAPFRPRRVAVISTRLPNLKESVIDKTLAVLRARLAPSASTIVADRRIPHTTEAVASAIADAARDAPDLVVLFGASAVTDIADVLPAGLVAAGGEIERFGMPVDPGNLLLLGRHDGRPVVVAPGCARSPKENGFDWVLNRLIAGLTVTSDDIAALGVGGLLNEIVSRPRPREAPAPEPAAAPRIAAIVLAAGRSTRMGGPNKLLAPLDGRPLVRRAVEAACGSRATAVIVVTGHEAPVVRAALEGLPVRFVHNPAYAEGLSTSLAAGLDALGAEIEAAAVLLGDMPRVTAGMVDRLVDAYQPARGALIALSTSGGRRGNPVLWSRRFFPELQAIRGDTGGRDLLAAYPEAITEVEQGDGAAFDVDTPEALAALGAETTI
ncbi:NTP transferase domain-containing protein [Segnochrobactrum spirostomi]|uniref:NTP transferase domain-containing protein n=1 Tax=Segnochrobactrum spirostomi TaxID=2608987 RepID=A0A6A7Y321_9HYPH|nr:molybdopterin-binding/glycosyltransferase family 2 protein [Segnochrobactrum spirostomi]MQT12678.1 NTP transferase domain-containing protein [Segnochrobactrum spirostomi]